LTKLPPVSIIDLTHHISNDGERAFEPAHLHKLNGPSDQVFERPYGGHDEYQGSGKATHQDVQNWRALHQRHLPDQQCPGAQRNTSLRVLPQTAAAKTEMMECLVSLIGSIKLAKCSDESLGLDVEEQPFRRAQGVG
jgi:hypothetical protein